MREAPDDPPHAWSGAERAWATTLLLLLSVLLALWGAFLVPFRLGDALVPVAWAVAVLGNFALGRAGTRLAGTTGALVPALVWLGLVFALSMRRTEGDVVVPGTVVGTGFLLTGVVASAVAYGMAVVRPRPVAGAAVVSRR